MALRSPTRASCSGACEPARSTILNPQIPEHHGSLHVQDNVLGLKTSQERFFQGQRGQGRTGNKSAGFSPRHCRTIVSLSKTLKQSATGHEPCIIAIVAGTGNAIGLSTPGTQAIVMQDHRVCPAKSVGNFGRTWRQLCSIPLRCGERTILRISQFRRHRTT